MSLTVRLGRGGRSIDINTEMGVFVASREMARTLAEEIDESLPSSTYRVILEDGELRWYSEAGSTVEVVQGKRNRAPGAVS